MPASHGWYWLKRGFGLLGRAPLPLLLLMLMLITASNLFGILGILGLVLAKLVVPVLLVGYLATLRELAPPGSNTPVAAQSAVMTEPGTRAFTQIFNARVFFGWAQGNRRALLTVAQLGLLSLAIDTGAAWLSGYQDAVAAMFETLSQMPANKVPDAEAMSNLIMPVFQSMMTMAVITVPCYLLLWYAPIFAGLHGLPLLKSVVFSAVAVGRNALAFVCHALCLLVFLISVALVTQVPRPCPLPRPSSCWSCRWCFPSLPVPCGPATWTPWKWPGKTAFPHGFRTRPTEAEPPSAPRHHPCLKQRPDARPDRPRASCATRHDRLRAPGHPSCPLGQSADSPYRRFPCPLIMLRAGTPGTMPNVSIAPVNGLPFLKDRPDDQALDRHDPTRADAHCVRTGTPDSCQAPCPRHAGADGRRDCRRQAAGCRWRG